MKGSLVIISFFMAGLLLSRLNLLDALFYGADYTSYVLYFLMFFVGISVGSDTSIVGSVKKYGFKIFLLPIATIIGTLVGCAVLGMVWGGRSVSECMAVGSGFGYYSLSTIIINQIKGAELGTVGLISNISREIITLLFAPLLVTIFGRLAPISSGGATTMDTTLPIITQTSGKEFVVLAIFHGFCVDFSVPFLVTFFASL
ncbi:MAG: lysine exporter LysO family protein [Rikenellaceae bacterium]